MGAGAGASPSTVRARHRPNPLWQRLALRVDRSRREPATIAARAPRRARSVGEGQAVGPTIGAAIDRSPEGRPLSPEVASRMKGVSAATLAAVRLHDDPAAHAAADLLGARAFTVGSSVYFSRGEHRPASSGGLDTLAHEVAHAQQQAGSSRPPSAELTLSAPSGVEESEADRFANALHERATPPTLSPQPSGRVARIMRLLKFSLANGKPAVVKPEVDEGHPHFFKIAYGTPDTQFKWPATVRVTGDPEDRYQNWQMGMLQVLSSYTFDVWWTGQDETHRTTTVETPIRDAVGVSHIWFSDDMASKEPFTASGDERSATMEDNPGVAAVPFENPTPGKTSTQGRFVWSARFVAFVSAHDMTIPYDDAAYPSSFQHVASLAWSLALKGTFPAQRLTGPQIIGAKRVVITESQGSAEGVKSAEAAAVAPILSGPVGVDEINKNLNDDGVPVMGNVAH
jgi:hypothetical protein